MTTESPLVDVTSKEIGGNITSETLTQLPSVNGNFIGFIGLLPGIVPSISTESFGSDSISVNGQDPRNNNYIGRRRQQQRRRHRAARRDAGADADRGDPGVPGHHQPVRRGVRPHLWRGGQRGDESRAPTTCAAARSASSRTRSLTTKDFFAKQKDLTKADTSYQRWGGTVGGPIVQRQDPVLLQPGALRDRPAEHDRDSGAARPERPADDAGSGLEHDHPRRSPDQRQQHLQRALAARDLAADEPDHPHGDPGGHRGGRPRGVGRRPDAGVQRQLRPVEHQGQHDAPDLDPRERRRSPTPASTATAATCRSASRRWRSRTSPISRTTPAQSRINDAHPVRRNGGWFLPGKHGDHDLKLGAQYEYSGATNRNEGNLNGTFAFGRSNAPFNAVEPAHLSGPLHASGSAVRATSTRRRTMSPAFAQDKWRLNQRLDAQPRRCATTSRSSRVAETGRSAGRDIPGRQEQLPAARRRHLRPGRRPQHRPRRLRALLRQDALRADRRPLHRHAVHVVVHRELPDGGRRSGPAQRPVPDGSVPGQRAGRQPRAARAASSRAASCCGTPARAGTTRIARTPYTDQLTAGYERQLARQHGGQRGLRPRVQPRPADVEGSEPGAARDDGGDLAAGPRRAARR